jgi:glycosyltransferase involved in cell wall biosynthesis
MTVVAIVQSYPYESFAGGDGAYIQALGQYLIDIGHDVIGFVSDTTRDRSNPLYQSPYSIERYRSWIVRRSIKLSPRTVLSFRLGFLQRALAPVGLRIGPRVKLTPEQWAAPEARWLLSQFDNYPPDIVILCFEAIYFAPWLKPTGIPLFGLPGSPMFAREIRAAAGRLDVKDAGQNERHQKIASALRLMDQVGFASHEDRNFSARHLCITDGIVVGMGFPPVPVAPDRPEPVVLFVGNMTEANEQALAWFLSEIWPNVRTDCPTATFRVVGRAIAAIRIGNPQAIGIELIGPVSDLGPQYAAAQVVVAPLVFGTTGVKIKVAEAMAHGRPLVTTSVGTDPGFADQLDPGAIVANDAKAFAAAIVMLLKEPTVRVEKSKGARQVFDSCYSQEGCYRELVEWVSNQNPSVSAALNRT